MSNFHIERLTGSGALAGSVAHFHARLEASPNALQHMKWRGKVAVQLIDHFHLGLSDGTLLEALAGRASDPRAVRNELMQIGVIRSNGDERFAGTLVVPVFDASRQVVQLRGGEYHVTTGRNTNERIFPRGVENVFHLEGLELSEEVIVTSTAMDSLRLWYAGHVNVSALGEDLALTEAHLAAMKRAGTKRVVLALSAGANADAIAIAAAGRLDGAGIQAYRATIGRRFMPTSRRWGELLRAATPMLGAPARPELPRIDLDWSRLPKKESR